MTKDNIPRSGKPANRGEPVGTPPSRRTASVDEIKEAMSLVSPKGVRVKNLSPTWEELLSDGEEEMRGAFEAIHGPKDMGRIRNALHAAWMLRRLPADTPESLRKSADWLRQEAHRDLPYFYAAHDGHDTFYKAAFTRAEVLRRLACDKEQFLKQLDDAGLQWNQDKHYAEVKGRGRGRPPRFRNALAGAINDYLQRTQGETTTKDVVEEVARYLREFFPEDELDTRSTGDLYKAVDNHRTRKM